MVLIETGSHRPGRCRHRGDRQPKNLQRNQQEAAQMSQADHPDCMQTTAHSCAVGTRDSRIARSSSRHELIVRTAERRVKACTTYRCALAFTFTLGAASNALAYTCPQDPPPARTDTYQGFLGRVHELDGQELPYRLFVPKDYDASKAYPLVLYLHHAGLAGSDGNNETGWDNCVHLTSEIGSGDDYGGVFTHRAVDEAGNRFDTQERYPHFVLAPHANSPMYGFGGGVAGSATAPEHPTRRLLLGILEQIQSEFSIDPGRLYVTGISMGCYGTWDIIMRNPGVFAAAAPQSCRGDPNTALLSALKDMPIWSMCGTNDSYFAGAQAMADAMAEVGETAFTFTAMQGVGHSINDRGYDYPGFIDWMFAQRVPGVEPPGVGGAGGGAGASGMANVPGGGGGSGGHGGQLHTGPTGGAGVGATSSVTTGGSSGGALVGAMPSTDSTAASESSCSIARPHRAVAGLPIVLILGLGAASLRRIERRARRAPA